MNALYDLSLLLVSTGEGWGPGSHDGAGWWIFGPIMAALLITLIAVVIWRLIRGGRPDQFSSADRARGILAERYARGELSGDEYRERLDGLR